MMLSDTIDDRTLLVLSTILTLTVCVLVVFKIVLMRSWFLGVLLEIRKLLDMAAMHGSVTDNQRQRVGVDIQHMEAVAVVVAETLESTANGVADTLRKTADDVALTLKDTDDQVAANLRKTAVEVAETLLAIASQAASDLLVRTKNGGGS